MKMVGNPALMQVSVKEIDTTNKDMEGFCFFFHF